MNGAAPGRPGPAPADLLSAYLAARAAAILAERGDLTRLFISGRDALDLMHRLSSNALTSLGVGEGAATVFTTNKGRILDLVTLHRLPEGQLALCGAGRAATIRDWIEKYTFREEVSVADWTGSHRTLGIYGPHAGRVVESLWGPGAAGRPPHAIVNVPIKDGGSALLVQGFPLGGDGYLITAPNGAIEALRRALLEVQVERPVEAGPECLEVLRIEAGLPASGRELTDEYNPWEARLQDAVSLTKGCYVGQEVVARLHTYRKVSRQLVRITVPGGPEGAAHKDTVVPGALIRSGALTLGAVTSSAAVPGGGGRVVALGYVRDEDAVSGRAVEIAHAGRSVPAIIEGVAR